ncbi:MAG: glycosyltransferase family 9 protein [Turneriella sp.]|nr:glycosyltransferase family 9 protein [Turneriella sp.]
MPEKILVASFKLLGDLIVQTPALTSLRKAFPAAHIILLCDARYATALSTNEDIDEVWGCPLSEAKKYSGFRKMYHKTVFFFHWAFRIRRFGFTRIILMDHNDRACIWAFFSGAKIRGGLRHQSMSFLLSRRLDDREGSADYIDFYVRLAVLIGGTPGIRRTTFPIPAGSPSVKQLLPEVRDGYFVIHPGASLAEKRWPAGRWAELIAAVGNKRPAAKFVLISGPGEGRLCDEIRNAVGSAALRGRVVIFAEHPLLETAIIMRPASLVFCLDSASRHLAAALGVPTISLMAKWILPTWGLYAPEQKQFTLAADVPRDNYSIESISVNDVMALFMRATRNNGGAKSLRQSGIQKRKR